MNIVGIKIFFLILLTSFASGYSQSTTEQENAQIEIENIQNLIANWKGTLTYMDYSSNSSFSLPCNLKITSLKENRKLLFYYTYPNEPKANNKSKFKISKDRKFVDNKEVILNAKLPNGEVQIITEYNGKDGNEGKKALIRNIYVIGENKFVSRKEVQYLGTNKWLQRNEFLFTKN